MRAVSTYSLLSKRCLAECPASSAQYMSVIWRGKCCTKTVVLSVTVSSCPSATEMASNKLQENLPFRWQKSLPTNAEVHGASRTVSRSFHASLFNNKFEARVWDSLAEMTNFPGGKTLSCCFRIVFILLFVSYFPALAPCQTRERVPSSFLYLIQSLAKTTWSPFHKPLLFSSIWVIHLPSPVLLAEFYLQLILYSGQSTISK